VIRPFLWPLAPVYAAAVAAKNAAYDHGWLKAKQLRWPVVSIGNISVGGSGKTPLAIHLAVLLKQSGLHIDVLSRGYGRNSGAVERVDPAGSAARFGDEPLLIAQLTNVPVYVGASRYAAGLLAEKEAPGDGLHLLDDGFQHRQLARSVDILVVHRNDFEEMLLPSGNLREPFSAFKRAAFLVLRSEDEDLEAQLRQKGITAPLWWIDRAVQLPECAGRALAFCGIARPSEFFASLRDSSMEIAATQSFRDHHSYTQADMQQLIQLAQTHAASVFLTTEKDFVRLSPEQRKILDSVAPLQVARLTVTLRDEAGTLEALLALLPSNPDRAM
jgi:tetraacyldisaccharide 4'-kinase